MKDKKKTNCNLSVVLDLLEGMSKLVHYSLVFTFSSHM